MGFSGTSRETSYNNTCSFICYVAFVRIMLIIHRKLTQRIQLEDLPRSHKKWHCLPYPDKEKVGSYADFILNKLYTEFYLVASYNINKMCKNIHLYRKIKHRTSIGLLFQKL